MTTINEILESLGIEDTETKTASAPKTYTEKEIEKEAENLGLLSKPNNGSITKIASSKNTNGGNMDLKFFYDQMFNQEKVAEVETQNDEQAVNQEQEKIAAKSSRLGELTGRAFNEELDRRLFKFAAEAIINQAPDSAATQAAGGYSDAVVPGASVGNPQMPVGVHTQDGQRNTAMDTTPEFYDDETHKMLQQAIEQQMLLNTVAKPEGVQGSSVSKANLEMELPAAQG